MHFIRSVLFAGALFLLISPRAFAQYATPNSFWLNPQLTAPTAMASYNYQQVSAHYRQQSLVNNIRSRSMVLSGQFSMYGKRNTQFGTIGLNLMRDESGSSYLFSTSGAMFSYNYDVSLSSRHHLVAGVQGGYFSRSIDWNKVTTSSQYNNGQFEPGINHGENFTDYRSHTYTTNVGLAYYLADMRGEQLFHIGLGMINANKGRFTYLDNDENQAEPVRWVAYSQFRVFSSPSFEVVSDVYWQQESGVSDFMGGLQLRRSINPRETVSDEHLGLGLHYSPDHAATLSMQLMKPNWLLGLSYSMPFGNQQLQNVQNVAEVTLGWRMQRPGKRGSFYGGGSRGKMPYQAKKTAPWQPNKKAPSYKFKPNRKPAPAFKKKFGRKIAPYKFKTKKKATFNYKIARKKAFKHHKKVNKSRGISYNPMKFKKWKPKRRSAWKPSGRRFKGWKT
ncbi:PorP/SprF family type IX secretion system membrane protein [Cesiribacter sp. SM1]|uniref:PorP/SprF family type IX secretion system membrane protein n=1 Tax=Cesiribacter sp. SM1 TaxID=2861196 RepID=UPI001CD314EA|nr:PorP/SprF family type IX secretion system membrane protein [Cesiribacter sp. SM1]